MASSKSIFARRARQLCFAVRSELRVVSDLRDMALAVNAGGCCPLDAFKVTALLVNPTAQLCAVPKRLWWASGEWLRTQCLTGLSSLGSQSRQGFRAIKNPAHAGCDWCEVVFVGISIASTQRPLLFPSRVLYCFQSFDIRIPGMNQ